MQFWTQHTLSFRMMYDTTCYPSGMSACHFWWPLLQHYKDIRHYKETKTRLQKAERQSSWRYIEDIIEVGNPDQEHQPKQKRLLSFIKSLRRDNSGKEKGRLYDDPKDKADILNRQYESTWTK